jgi:hypothetical protein
VHPAYVRNTRKSHAPVKQPDSLSLDKHMSSIALLFSYLNRFVCHTAQLQTAGLSHGVSSGLEKKLSILSKTFGECYAVPRCSLCPDMCAPKKKKKIGNTVFLLLARRQFSSVPHLRTSFTSTLITHRHSSIQDAFTRLSIERVN